MKLRFKSSTLEPFVETIAAVAPRADPRPVLQNVLIDATGQHTSLSATDTFATANLTLGPDQVEVLEPGRALVLAHRLHSILRENGNDVGVMHVTPSKCTIQFSQRSFTLAVEDPHDYPPIKADASDVRASNDLRFVYFRGAIQRVVEVAHDQASNKNLNGVLFDFLPDVTRIVSTDGRILCTVSFPASNAQPYRALVPAAQVDRLLRAGPAGKDDKDAPARISIGASKHMVTAIGARGRVSVRVMNGVYPPYERGFLTNPRYRILAPRIRFMSLLEQVLLLRSKIPLTLQVVLDPAGRVTWTVACAEERFDQTEDVPWSADRMVLYMSPKPMFDTLKRFRGESLLIEFTSPMHQIVFRECAASTDALTMPDEQTAAAILAQTFTENGFQSQAVFSPVRPIGHVA